MTVARRNIPYGAANPIVSFLGASRIISESYREWLSILVLDQSVEPPEHFMNQVKLINRGESDQTKVIFRALDCVILECFLGKEVDQFWPDKPEPFHVFQEVRFCRLNRQLAARDGRHPYQNALEHILRGLVRLYALDPQIVLSASHDFTLSTKEGNQGFVGGYLRTHGYNQAQRSLRRLGSTSVVVCPLRQSCL